MKKIIVAAIFTVVTFAAFTQNVGIGTTTPAFKLDVVGRMRIKAGTPNNVLTSAGLWMDDYRDGTNRFFFGMKDSIRAGFYGGGAGGTGWDFTFNTRNGNIGVGYLDPDFYKLSVDGEIGLYRTNQAGTNLYGSLEYNTGDLVINARRGNLITNTSAQDIILQYGFGAFGVTSGKVGIGINNPSEKLHLNGNFIANGHITSSGNIATTANISVAGNIAASGNITMTGGELNRSNTGTTDLLPKAFGQVSGDGTVLGGSGNFTVTKTGTGQYTLQISPGFGSYLIITPWGDAVFIRTVTYAYSSEGFLIYSYRMENVYDSQGNLFLVKTEPYNGNFNFIAYGN